MEHLFSQQDKLKSISSYDRVFLFLDYDGTLVKIAKTPDKAILPEKTRCLLKDLANNPCVKIAIISGRSLGTIKRMVNIKNIIYVGSHGLEIEGNKLTSLVSYKHKVILKHIKNDLQQKTSSIPRVFIENKEVSLSMHYRLADKKDIVRIKKIFHESVSEYILRKEIKVRPGKMVLEVMPSVDWNKGDTVLWLLSRYTAKSDVLSVYIGDDTTDEDAFKVLKGNGLTIRVGKSKKSFAQYFLKNPAEVSIFLRKISRVYSNTEMFDNKY